MRFGCALNAHPSQGVHSAELKRASIAVFPASLFTFLYDGWCTKHAGFACNLLQASEAKIADPSPDWICCPERIALIESGQGQSRSGLIRFGWGSHHRDDRVQCSAIV